MTARPIKRSVTLQGHRTSVSLEEAFWRAFREIAAERDIAINALASEIDEGRAPDTGLGSAIRVYVLRHYQTRVALEHPRPTCDARPVAGQA